MWVGPIQVGAMTDYAGLLRGLGDQLGGDLCYAAALEIERLSAEGRIMRDALRRISALDKNYKWESEAIADDALAAVSGTREKAQLTR